MNVEFESFEFDGKKKRVLTEEGARKAFIRKHLPPMSWKQRYGALMEAFELSCQSRQRWALRMKAALEANDPFLIKQVAQQWVDYELPPRP
jgi:hypothetical protein